VRNPAAQGRADANHGDVRDWYQEQFCSVVDLHTVGKGCPDFLIGCNGYTELVECKTENGELNDKQEKFIKNWRGSKVVIVRNQNDVIRHVYSMRIR
jgi:VRR-NUC domain